MVGLRKCSPQDEAEDKSRDCPEGCLALLMHLGPKWVQNWDAAVPFCATSLRIFFSCWVSPLVKFLVCALPQARISAAYQGLRAVSLLQSEAVVWC